MLRLKDLREDNNLRHSNIAKLLHVFQTNYSKYELGKINIPVNFLIVLATFYNTNIDYLLRITDEYKPYNRIKHIS